MTSLDIRAPEEVPAYLARICFPTKPCVAYAQLLKTPWFLIDASPKPFYGQQRASSLGMRKRAGLRVLVLGPLGAGRQIGSLIEHFEAIIRLGDSR
jgi:hypothetical protein